MADRQKEDNPLNVKLYIAMHKPYRTPQDGMYVPLQVGAAQHEAFLEARDNGGEDQISGKNSTFCELTGLYWMRRNAAADAVGLVHYRRHFSLGRTKDVWESVLAQEQAEKLLDAHEAVLPKKRHYVIETNWSQYAHAHYEKDLTATREVLRELCPEYIPAFDATMKRRSGHRFNMMIMRQARFEQYCDWLFPILFELEKRIDISDYDAYNKRVFGFIGERLLDVWAETVRLDYCEIPVIDMEPVNWAKKGGAFVMRKLKALCGKGDGLRSKS
ncbi:MAG: DUF4422 domain-containing protein [Clostridia bacterium]|nr:DUF4422 domain-containing protein [Clostridia bacterium]